MLGIPGWAYDSDSMDNFVHAAAKLLECKRGSMLA